MLLIGFGNKSRNGKDTAAEAIKDFYDKQTAARRAHVRSYKGTTVEVFKFATALYEEVNDAIENGIFAHRTVSYVPTTDCNCGGKVELISMDVPDWVQPEPNPEVNLKLYPYGKHPKLLQWWGTEYRRQNFGYDYWVKKTMTAIPANLDIALISDLRFKNEADAIKQRGGYTVNVQRLREDGTQYQDPSRPADHVSEIDLDNHNWSYRLISPDGQRAWTEHQAINLAEYLRGLHK